MKAKQKVQVNLPFEDFLPVEDLKLQFRPYVSMSNREIMRKLEDIEYKINEIGSRLLYYTITRRAITEADAATVNDYKHLGNQYSIEYIQRN
jgi:hypothetical protein